MKSKESQNQVKQFSIIKGTRELIIRQVLKDHTVTKPDLIKAIPNVTDRSIRRRLATLRSMSIVLTVDSSTGGLCSNMTTISLNHMLAEAFEDYGNLSPGEIKQWSFTLAIADSVIRSFLKNPERGPIEESIAKSKLRTLVESFPVGSPAEEKLLNKVRSILEGIAGIWIEDSEEWHHARVDKVHSRNTEMLNQRPSHRQPKSTRHLRTASSGAQAEADRSLPGGWLERSRRAVRKVGEGIYRRVGEVLGSV